jgi:S1-C subfamily serine protease
MPACPNCGRRYQKGTYCQQCGARLAPAEGIRPEAKLFVLAGVMAAVALFLAFLLGAGYLASSGFFRSPANLTVTTGRNISCGSDLAYSLSLSGEDGSPLPGQAVEFYGDGARLERLVTDQNGRLYSSMRVPQSWCGRSIGLSFSYAGDLFHGNASYSTAVIARIPTAMTLAVPPTAMEGTNATFEVGLSSQDGSPVPGRTVTVTDGGLHQAVTDQQGNAFMGIVFNTTGYQSVSAAFGGDQAYLPSSSPPRMVLVSPQACTDGTPVGECSAQAGYYCGSNRSLGFDCAKCGCPGGLECYRGSCVSGEQRTAQEISDLQDSVVLVQNSYALGSGVIIGHEDGKTVILTNRHVVKDAVAVSDVKVTMNDQKNATAGDVRVAPHDMDLAVIYLDGTYGTPASIDQSDIPLKGEDVVALGSPYGLQGSVSKGIVSNFVNDSTSSGYVHGLVQTDAAVNPGNSGGGLFLLGTGDLIGINTWKYVNTSGLNFAIDIREFEKLQPYSSWEPFTAVLRCSDGTPYGSCSDANAGLFCSNGGLYYNCRFCGCDDGYVCLYNDKCFYCPSGNYFTDNSGRALCCPTGWTGWSGSPPFCCPPGTSGKSDGTCQ